MSTDNARAEALAKERYPLREETNYHAGLYRGFLEGWAAGRAETTTEDAEEVLHGAGWFARADLDPRVLHGILHDLADAGLLATAHTRPTREELVIAIRDADLRYTDNGMAVTAGDYADAVLALLADQPTPADIAAQALEAAASAAVTEDEGIPWDDDYDRATVSTWLAERAADLRKGADHG